MFELAVSLGWLEKNPFGHLRGCSVANHTRDFFVKPELAAAVLAACPNSRWRLIFSLGRWGGLRIPSEITFLHWSDVEWSKHRIRISIPKKTSLYEQTSGIFDYRFIPIFPELRQALEDYRQEFSAEETAETVSISESPLLFPELGSDSAGALLRKGLTNHLKRAGLPVWPKLFNDSILNSSFLVRRWSFAPRLLHFL